MLPLMMLPLIMLPYISFGILYGLAHERCDVSTLDQTKIGVPVSLEFRKGHVMKVVQLERFKRALKAQQRVAIHDLGENREAIAVERSADEMDQTGRSTEQEFTILGLNRRSELLRNIEKHCAALSMGPSALAATVKGRLGGIV